MKEALRIEFYLGAVFQNEVHAAATVKVFRHKGVILN